MRIGVVADVHGNYDALSRVADEADRLVILGDLLDYIDYHDPHRGIVGQMFGPDNARRFARLRAAGAFAELREFNRTLWGALADPAGTLAGIVRERYRRVLASIPADTVVTLGNVDVAEEWNTVAGAVMPYRDGEVVTIGGLDFAFVAGGVRPSHHQLADVADVIDAGLAGSDRHRPPPHPWRPLMRSHRTFASVVDALPAADILCSHIPPDIAALRFDVVPGRVEMAGPGLREYMQRWQPLLALAGHVHQPLRDRARVGFTECRNVGHFQRQERAFWLDTDRLQEARTTRATRRQTCEPSSVASR